MAEFEDIGDLSMALSERGLAQKDLRERLANALSDQDVRDWARRLGQYEPNANEPRIDRIDRLIGGAARSGRARMLVRLARNSPAPILREYAAQVQPVHFLPNDDLIPLHKAFEPFARNDWPALLKAARLYFKRESEWLPHDWNNLPLTVEELRSRIAEVIDALREQRPGASRAFREPLLGFVRHLLCHSDLRARAGVLRAWLLANAAALGSAVDPVAIVAASGLPLDPLEHRLKVRTRWLGGADNPWDAALDASAIRVVVVLGPGATTVPAPDALKDSGEFLPLLVLLLPGTDLERVPSVLKDRDLCVRVSGPDSDSWDHALDQLERALEPEGPRIESFDSMRQPRALSEALEQAVETVASQIRSPIVFIVGPAASRPEPEACEQESRIKAGHALARALLSEIEVVPANSHAHVPLAFAGELYSMKKPRKRLLDALRSCSGLAVPTTARQLAALLKTLDVTSPRPCAAPLIITTNIDLHLERAFLDAELPFVRIVQGDKQSFVARHVPGSAPAVTAEELGDRELQDFCTGLGRALRPWDPILDARVAEDETVVLYKYFGSIDRENTCVVSLSSYEARCDAAPPTVLLQRARNDQLVLLGYTVLDPEVGHLLKTLLRERVGQDPNVAVQFPLTSDCDRDPWCYQRQLWHSMPGRWTELAAVYRVPFRQVEAPGDDFLKEVSARIN